MYLIKVYFFIFIMFNCNAISIAQNIGDPLNEIKTQQTKWGHATPATTKYKPQKILYDLSSGDENYFDNILDRVSYLFKLYNSDVFESSIVVIVHGDAIPFFAIDKFTQFKQRMIRAQSLTVGSTIEFRMCEAAAKVLNYAPKDIHGFVKMVPMADAEIVRLQNEEGYAYMQ
ncbi:hypothetical protein MNBD_GAMMA08-3155 [hydrothermal vent metagenome]|uniref:Uncharacterized protein n=1 Tax=hydrothermal vent metagenome TaxID=652676 RepID=A0A3B0WYR2_9ZZZZ